MAFSDFKTISEVQEKFRITYAEDDFVEAEPSSPSVAIWTTYRQYVYPKQNRLCIG